MPTQSHPSLDRPVRQHHQLRGRRGTPHLLLASAATIGHAGTGHHGVAVHVQERAALDHHLHRHHPLPRSASGQHAGPDGGLVMKSPRCVLEATGRIARDPASYQLRAPSAIGPRRLPGPSRPILIPGEGGPSQASRHHRYTPRYEERPLPGRGACRHAELVIRERSDRRSRCRRPVSRAARLPARRGGAQLIQEGALV